eukprot:SAG11_NODE_1715_length_4396_cov_3.282290_5_plen_115_part_00
MLRGAPILQSACAEGDTTLGDGGATALALQQCLMESRTNFYDVDMNCLDIGGLDCGQPYVCTDTAIAADAAAAAAAAEAEAADAVEPPATTTSGTASMALAASVVAASVAASCL